MSEFKFKIEGMMCDHCKMKVEKALQAVSGVESVQANVEGKEVVVTGNADHKQIVIAIQMAGYSVVDKPGTFNYEK